MFCKIYLTFFIILFLCVIILIPFSKTNATVLKNIFVLIEPLDPKFNTSNSEDQDHDHGIFLMSEASFLLDLMEWFNSNKSKFENIVFKIGGMKQEHHHYHGPPIGDKNHEVYNRKKLDKINKKKLAEKIYIIGRNIKEYKIAKELAAFSQSLSLLEWKGEETLFVILGDINFVGRFVSSHGGYLNSGWLKNEKSPFKLLYLDEDNKASSKASIVVFTRTQLNIIHESKRKSFISNLFVRANANLKIYYIGSINNSLLPNNNNFGISLIEKIQNNKIEPLAKMKIVDTHFVQIIDSEGREQNVRSFE